MGKSRHVQHRYSRTDKHKLMIRTQSQRAKSDTKHPLYSKLLSLGYFPKGYGYFKEKDGICHWVTLFESGSLQMYAYESSDPEMEDVYNTQILENVTAEELEVMAKVWERKAAND